MTRPVAAPSSRSRSEPSTGWPVCSTRRLTTSTPAADSMVRWLSLANWLVGSLMMPGNLGWGQRYHVAALHAAHSADDQLLGAHILGCMADQAARRGRAAEAVTLIESAMVGIRDRTTPRLRAELCLRKAYARHPPGRIGLYRGRLQGSHPDRAVTPDSDPPWLYWMSPVEITAGAGDCLLQLGQPAQATTLLDEGIAMFDKSFTRDRQGYLTHLADALARPGKRRDLDAAADRGLAAVHLTECLTPTRGIDCLRDLYPRMQPHAPIPAVRNFLERARGVLAA